MGKPKRKVPFARPVPFYFKQAWEKHDPRKGKYFLKKQLKTADTQQQLPNDRACLSRNSQTTNRQLMISNTSINNPNSDVVSKINENLQGDPKLHFQENQNLPRLTAFHNTEMLNMEAQNFTPKPKNTFRSHTNSYQISSDFYRNTDPRSQSMNNRNMLVQEEDAKRNFNYNHGSSRPFVHQNDRYFETGVGDPHVKTNTKRGRQQRPGLRTDDRFSSYGNYSSQQVNGNRRKLNSENSWNSQNYY